MRGVRFIRLTAVVLALGMTQPASANGDTGSGGDGRRPRVAPAPMLGAGILGAIVLAGGCLVAFRRKR